MVSLYPQQKRIYWNLYQWPPHWQNPQLNLCSYRVNSEEYDIAKAWKAKCEQVIMKARFSMKEDKATLAEIEKYAQELKIK